MDTLTGVAQSLGSPDVVVLTQDDYDALAALAWRATSEGFTTEEERLRLSLVWASSWQCPGARKVSV